MADESFWIERAQSAEAKLATLKENYAPALERVKLFKSNFGLKERASGEIVIDYDKFLEALGPEGFLELRRVGDEKYGVKGKAGEKPHMRVKA